MDVIGTLICMGLAVPFVIPVGVRWDKIRARRAMRRARAAAIADAKDGKKACISGVVELDPDDEPLISPLSQVPCVYWEIAADEGGGSDWTWHGSRLEACAFRVGDDSGTARIVDDNPLVLARPYELLRVSVRDVGRADPRSRGAPDLERALAPFGGKLDLVTFGTLRFTEYVIAPGSQVTVLGGCTREPDKTATEAVSGYREQLPTRPVLSGSRRAPLIIRVDETA